MRKILFFVALMFATIQATAAPVGLRSAQIEAQQFVQQQLYGGRLLAPITGEMKLAHVEMNSQKLDRPVFYIFKITTLFELNSVIAMDTFLKSLQSNLILHSPSFSYSSQVSVFLFQ